METLPGKVIEILITNFCIHLNMGFGYVESRVWINILNQILNQLYLLVIKIEFYLLLFHLE